MKNVFLSLLMFVSITTLAQEKETKRPNRDKFASLTTEQKIEYQVKKMTKDLNLNENQIKEVKALAAKEVEKREARKAKMQELKAQRNEMKAKMDEEHAATTAEMKRILSPEQFTKWEKINDERKEKMKEKMSQKRESKKLNAIPEEK